jgi:hypothetical protein
MSRSHRFIQTLAFTALALFFLLPPLHAQAANSNAKPATHSGNPNGNHKDVMTAAPGQNPSGKRNTSQQAAEVRTEKIKYKQQPDGSQAAPGDDNTPLKHKYPPASTAPSQSTTGSNGNAASGSSLAGTTKPQAAASDPKFKQEFGPTQVNKKN